MDVGQIPIVGESLKIFDANAHTVVDDVVPAEGDPLTYRVKKGEYTIEIVTDGIEEPEAEKVISLDVNDVDVLLIEQYPYFSNSFAITGDTHIIIQSTFE